MADEMVNTQEEPNRELRVTSEADLLDPGKRKKIIEAIEGPENKLRREEAYKRYLMFKDKTDRLVVEQLMFQFDMDTIREMTYAISNISLLKKVVEKLARVYSNGVQRQVTNPGEDKPNTEATKALQKLEGVLKFNTEMKKANRILKLQRNAAVYVRPIQTLEEDWKIKIEALQPYLYDVIPDPKDPSRPLAVVISNYKPNITGYTTLNPATAGRTTSIQPVGPTPLSDGKDEPIANQDTGNNSEEYIWWSPSFHFTTNKKGEYVGKPVNPSSETETDQHANPIERLPFEFFSIESDGKFWAEGGDDLVKGSLLVNSMLSQFNHIAVVQGYGQFFMKGKNLPKNVKVGPSKSIIMEYEKDDPTPEIGFVNANPDLDKLARLVEMYVALLLTTNNLSTSAVSAHLASGNTTLASGIALMIDKAESREDVQDQEQVFKDGEVNIWNLIAAWQEQYAGNLDEDYQGLDLPKQRFNVTLNFNPPQVIQSDSEKLDTLQKRKTLGINTQQELIMMDNPGMTEEAAKAKLTQLQLEANSLGGAMINNQGTEQQGNDPANAPDPSGNDPAAEDDPNAKADQ